MQISPNLFRLRFTISAHNYQYSKRRYTPMGYTVAPSHISRAMFVSHALKELHNCRFILPYPSSQRLLNTLDTYSLTPSKITFCRILTEARQQRECGVIRAFSSINAVPTDTFQSHLVSWIRTIFECRRFQGISVITIRRHC